MVLSILAQCATHCLPECMADLRHHHTPFIRIWINTPGPQGIARWIRVLGEVLNAAFKMGMGAMLQDRDHCGGLRFRRHSGGARIYLTSRAELRNRSKRHEPPIGGSVSRDGSAAAISLP